MNRDVPQILPLTSGSSDFHDSSLIWFEYDPLGEVAMVIVSTPDLSGVEHLWKIDLFGVLAMELESLGDGEVSNGKVPPEVYDVYDDTESCNAKRWNGRLEQLGIQGGVHDIVFASSYLRGWGKNEKLEGVHVVCRNFKVSKAPDRFSGSEFSRPRIYE